jgi:hypothetical protein
MTQSRIIATSLFAIIHFAIARSSVSEDPVESLRVLALWADCEHPGGGVTVSTPEMGSRPQ